jgi:hypothetical protein
VNPLTENHLDVASPQPVGRDSASTSSPLVLGWFSKAYPWTTVVLIDELDASGFKSAANG